jgi:hypothetical protein
LCSPFGFAVESNKEFKGASKEACAREQIGPISISNSEKK